MEWIELLRLLGQTLSSYVLRLDLLVIVGVVLFMIYNQYRRTAMVELRMFGFTKNHPMDQLKTALVYGAVGGVAVTFVFLFLGVSLAGVGIWQLWLIAIALMLIHPRFLCFSYGAGLLSLAHLIFGVPDIDIPALMALVAVLHLVEAVLIRVDGGRRSTPIFVRHRDGEVVGGFMLQKYWPIPFIALIGAAVPADLAQTAAGVSMPDWWPILRSAAVAPEGMQYAFALFPVIAALGYSDVAITCHPEVKARRTSWRLLAYSIGLLALAVLAQYALVFAVGAALFSPLAHEWVIRREKQLELDGEPYFSGAPTMILDVHPRSPAAAAGLASGDTITAVNGMPVATRQEFAEAMQPWAIDAQLSVVKHSGAHQTVTVKGKIPPLGVILVPGHTGGVIVEMGDRSPWRTMWRRWLSRRRKGA